MVNVKESVLLLLYVPVPVMVSDPIMFNGAPGIVIELPETDATIFEPTPSPSKLSIKI